MSAMSSGRKIIKATPTRIWVLFGFLLSLSCGQFLYNLRSSQGYLSENLLYLPCYHLCYLLAAGFLGVLLLALSAWIASRVCGICFRDSFRDRTGACLLLPLLLPLSFTAYPSGDVARNIYVLLVLAACLFLQLLLMFRAARSRRRLPQFCIFFVLLMFMGAAFALRVQCYFAIQRYTDSDEAVIGLMARHILYQGERPVFFYGQAYNGSLDAYVTALLFFFLGPVTSGPKLSAMLPLLVAIPLVYLAGRELHDYRTGLCAAALLSFSPALLIVLSTQQVGGFTWSLPLIALSFYLLLRMSDGRYLNKHPLLPWLAVGFLCGLMFYVQPITIPVIAAIFIFLFIRHRRLPLLPLLAGTLAGCLPLLCYNLGHRFASLRDIGAQAIPFSARQLMNNLHNEAFTAMPL